MDRLILRGKSTQPPFLCNNLNLPSFMWHRILTKANICFVDSICCRPSSSNAGSLPPKSPLNTRHESYHAKVTDEKTVINEDQREAVNEYAHLLKPPVSFAEFRRKLSLSRRPGLTPRTPPSQPRDTDEVPNPLKHIKRSHTSHW